MRKLRLLLLCINTIIWLFWINLKLPLLAITQNAWQICTYSWDTSFKWHKFVGTWICIYIVFILVKLININLKVPTWFTCIITYIPAKNKLLYCGCNCLWHLHTHISMHFQFLYVHMSMCKECRLTTSLSEFYVGLKYYGNKSWGTKINCRLKILFVTILQFYFVTEPWRMYA